eukprot:TRINITY_DN231_c0_g2_i1.p1 TRINITY_DN231_c0_g2~~TRINITY_DN231_c0_g2_i1.p1  ORF type:complete len:508 (+),score=93.98 TRINITY_DN231_c0_g2_i1:262-1785(+)
MGSESEAEEDYCYWAINNEYEIFSFADPPQPENSHQLLSQFFIRNPVGKFCWETEQVLAMDLNNLPPSPHFSTSPYHPAQLSKKSFKKGENDKVYNLLERFSTQMPEILPYKRNSIISGFNTPLNPSSYGDSIDRLESEIENFIKYESNALSQFEESRMPILGHPHVVSPSYSKFEGSRHLLNNFGFLARESRLAFHTLEQGKRLERMVKDMDNIRDREVCRIGILYVGYGQEEQFEILANTSGSARYTRFLQSIGWEVNLEEHTGFNGGLNAGVDGESSIYFCDDKTEVMFHVLTMMPADEKDEKLVRRKRHVGNDHVHIVWSEHKRDYDANVIKSQFNDAHIIIYPLANGMYRISVYKKTTIPDFGPLHDGMIVNDELLGVLVRLTAINANRSVRSTQQAYEGPFVMRKKYVKQVSDRHKFPEPIEVIHTRLFPREEEEIIQKTTNHYQQIIQNHPEHHIALGPELFISEEVKTENKKIKTRFSRPTSVQSFVSISSISESILNE